MAALTKPRATLSRSGDRRSFSVKAATAILQGALVAIDANSLAVPMTTATGLKGAGRAEASADNSSGANGALTIEVDAGIHRWGNSSSTDEITQADIGAVCYGVDDQTVAKTDDTGARSPAGTVFDVDADGVWVKPH